MNKPLAAMFSSALLSICCAAIVMAADSDAISNSARKKGMSDAPDLIKKTGIVCTLVDARQVEKPVQKVTFTRGISTVGTTIGLSLIHI